MSYAPPKWIVGLDESKPTILLLDDWTRSTPMMINAIMSIIQEKKYISWELPKMTTVILTSNPDNGSFNLSSEDSAQTSRYLTWNVEFDIKIWSKWAESVGIDGRCINFLAMNHLEVFKKDNPEINPRIMTKFFNSIKYTKNFSLDGDLEYIQLMATSIHEKQGEAFAAIFTSFVTKNMDKLIQPDEMLNEPKWKDVAKRVKECCTIDGKLRNDISGLLSMRFQNYCINYFKERELTPKHTERLIEFLKSDSFSEDLRYAALTEMYNSNSKKFKPIVINDVDLATKLIAME